MICPDFNEVEKYKEFIVQPFKKVILAKSSKDLKKIVKGLNVNRNNKSLMIEEFNIYHK